MIRFLSHNEINKRKWDATVENASNGMIYALSWYLDIVSPGWAALVEGDYEKVFPLPVKKKFGIQYVIQPPFVQQLGLFSHLAVNGKEVAEYIGSLPDRYRFMDIQLNEKNPVDGCSCKVVPRRNVLLNLYHDIPEKYYHENTRRNIRKFQKTGIGVVEDPVAAEDIIRLFAGGQGKKYGVAKAHYGILSRLLSVLGRKSLLTVCTVREGDRLISGAVFSRSYERYIFLFSAESPEGRDIHALAGIIDHFIRMHTGEKMWLDFEGSDNHDLARFYKSFGGKEVNYPRVIMNRLPHFMRWVKPV